MHYMQDYRGFCIRQVLSPHPPTCRHIINNISRYNIRQISTIMLRIYPEYVHGITHKFDRLYLLSISQTHGSHQVKKK